MPWKLAKERTTSIKHQKKKAKKARRKVQPVGSSSREVVLNG
eukprot:COSAG06_NODE_42981_length_376_cov_1.119134_2_plen_41_part_01